MRRLTLALSAVFLSHAAIAASAAPKVVASIVPVHALVAGVMEGVGEPSLLLSGQNSEHQASYSPAQLLSLRDADAVFIIGNGLELKLDELSGSEAVNGKTFFALSATKGLKKLSIREGGAWEAHEHEEEHKHEHEHAHDESGEQDHDAEQQEHGKAEFDPHLWLDPANAKVMVAKIADELSKIDSANAARYAENAKDMAVDLDTLTAEIETTLAPAKNQPYVVFHDAFQYFEARFGLAGVGSIADISANAPSAKRLKAVRDKIMAVKAVCVFREPQFAAAPVETVIEGSAARAGVLDPIGANLTPGKAAYRQLLVKLADGFKACLSPT